MAEPISLETARAHLRIVGDTSEDTLIEGVYIPAARRYVENRSGLILVQREFTEEHRAANGYFELYQRPVVTTVPLFIGYTDSDGAEQAYEDARLSEGRVYAALNGSWPYPGIGGFRVTYTAGLSAEELAGDDYKDLNSALLLMLGHLYKHREAVNIGNIVTEIELTVGAICDQYRRALL